MGIVNIFDTPKTALLTNIRLISLIYTWLIFGVLHN